MIHKVKVHKTFWYFRFLIGSKEFTIVKVKEWRLFKSVGIITITSKASYQHNIGLSKRLYVINQRLLCKPKTNI
jgi:hypothetical protein